MCCFKPSRHGKGLAFRATTGPSRAERYSPSRCQLYRSSRVEEPAYFPQHWRHLHKNTLQVNSPVRCLCKIWWSRKLPKRPQTILRNYIKCCSEIMDSPTLIFHQEFNNFSTTTSHFQQQQLHSTGKKKKTWNHPLFSQVVFFSPLLNWASKAAVMVYLPRYHLPWQSIWNKAPKVELPLKASRGNSKILQS